MFIRPEEWKPTPGIALDGTALEVVKSAASLSVLAGPGAGKTELLAQRAAYLLNTGICPPSKRILAIAFKVDAARNLQTRVEQRCELETARRFESLTLHAFAKRILDQFREALPDWLRPSSNFRIIFPNRDTWIEFQQRHSTEYPEIRSFNPDQLSNVLQEQIPNFDSDDGNVIGRLRRQWWETCLADKPSTVSFEMILLLAAHIVRTQPLVTNAINSTYTHVFLDEFQDVTGRQYDLVRQIFQGTAAIVTAVGDTNQAIMGWAGALPDIFGRFDRDFAAANRKLQFNFRSNSRIVDLINDLSVLFTEEQPIRTESARRGTAAPADAVQGWVFSDRNAEGAGLAAFIQESLAADPGLKPHDFVILARIRADSVEKRLSSYFAEKSLQLRNEARSLGPVTIQDIVKEPVFLFLTSLLKMAHGLRDGGPFQICRDLIAGLEGTDLSTERGAARSLRAVQEAVATASALTKDLTPPNLPSDTLAAALIPKERKDQFARTYKDYQNREYLDSVIDACVKFYKECAANAPTWATFIANLEGRDLVRIMTIHKSKGLEYHTVIFVEFNDDTFWNNEDDVNVFFVALSRARERIRFSITRDARGFDNVARFIGQLQESGVEFKNIERPSST